MKCLYAIITCDKNKSLRDTMEIAWCSATEHVWLTSEFSDGRDSYESSPYKLAGFFTRTCFDEYDWIIIIDDDTFVFTDRVSSFLEMQSIKRPVISRWAQFKNDKPYQKMISKHTPKLPVLFPRGGCGILIEGSVARDLSDYLRSTPFDTLPLEIHGDVSVGMWLRNVQDFKMVEHNELNYHPLNKLSKKAPKTALTLHYINTQELVDLCVLSKSQ